MYVGMTLTILLLNVVIILICTSHFQLGKEPSMAHVWMWRALLTLSTLLLVSSVINLVPLILKRNIYLDKTNSSTSAGREPSQKRHDADFSSSSVGVLDASDMDPTTIALQSDMLHKIREVESSVLFYSPDSRPLVVAKDISLGRYYAQRDLQGWTIAYKNLSFEVVEQSFRSLVKLSELSVFLCLGIHTQDKHCIKPSSYRTFTQSQKVNQIHGLRDTLWRKDAFCYTMREALGSYKGRKNFTFPCWVLPRDKEILQVEMSKRKMEWIVKPSGKGEGHGIFVVSTFKELSSQNTDGFVVQSFLRDPYLVHGRKFDFRTYVLVTSMVPLRAYIYREGLVRFASSKYDRNATKGGKEQQFLTNTSVGKKYTQLSNLTWTFQKLKQYFTKCGIDSEKVFESVNEAIVRTLLAAEYRFLRDFHLYLGGYDCHNCFQLLGVDVILDSKLNPLVIEVSLRMIMMFESINNYALVCVMPSRQIRWLILEEILASTVTSWLLKIMCRWFSNVKNNE